MPAVYGERAHLEVSGGLKVETIKDLAPQWMRDEFAAEALAGGKIEVLDDDALAVPRLLKTIGEN